MHGVPSTYHLSQNLYFITIILAHFAGKYTIDEWIRVLLAWYLEMGESLPDGHLGQEGEPDLGELVQLAADLVRPKAVLFQDPNGYNSNNKYIQCI